MTARLRRPVVLVVLLAGAWATVVAQTSRTFSSEFDRSVEASAGGQLTLDLQAGGDVYLQGWDENRVAVHVRLAGGNWADTEVALEPVRGGVRLSARLPPLDTTTSTAHRFEIRVPHRYKLQLDSTGGKLWIRDLEGTFTGHTAGGSIDLERVRGRVELRTASGQIRVRDADVEGFVTTGWGAVNVVNNRGRLRTERREDSASRAAVDTKPEMSRRGSAEQIRIRQTAGPINLAEAPGGADVYTASGGIRIGRSSGSVRAGTGAGTIELGLVQGSVIARTGKGDVHVSFVEVGANQSIDIDSGSGAVILDFPSSFSAEQKRA